MSSGESWSVEPGRNEPGTNTWTKQSKCKNDPTSTRNDRADNPTPHTDAQKQPQPNLLLKHIITSEQQWPRNQTLSSYETYRRGWL